MSATEKRKAPVSPRGENAILPNGKKTSEEIRDIYLQSGLSAVKLSEILEINKNTLECWFSLKRNPPVYVAYYIKERLELYNKRVKDNSDVIRKMDNDELAEFLTDIRDDALFAEGNEDKIKEEYKSFDDFLEGTSLVKNYKGKARPELPFADKNSTKSTAEEIRDIYLNTGLSYVILSDLLKVSTNTLNTWISLKANPPRYVVNYVKMRIQKYEETVANNADVIRKLSNSDLAEFLTDIRDDALYTNGEEGNVKEEYKSFDDFLEQKSLMKRYKIYRRN